MDEINGDATPSVPVPSGPSETEPEHESVAAPGTAAVSTSSRSGAAVTIAVLWAIAALIIGFGFITSVEDGTYGGDAYTDIQNTGAQTVRAIGWLIISTGPLSLVMALSRR